jgi:ABC-type dipeptide/oligopeptide/nickel transport system permease subunit
MTTLYLLVKGMNGRILVGGVMLVIVLALAIFAPLIATQSPTAIDASRAAAGAERRSLVRHRRARTGHVQPGRLRVADLGDRRWLGRRHDHDPGHRHRAAGGLLPRLDGVIMRVMDAFQSFPSILLAIAIMAALGASARNVIIALTVTYSPRTARGVRGKVLSIREETYIESARAIGLGDNRIMGRYVLPNTMAPLIVQATFILAWRSSRRRA